LVYRDSPNPVFDKSNDEHVEWAIVRKASNLSFVGHNPSKIDIWEFSYLIHHRYKIFHGSDCTPKCIPKKRNDMSTSTQTFSDLFF
jgi:hypothetical protein